MISRNYSNGNITIYLPNTHTHDDVVDGTTVTYESRKFDNSIKVMIKYNKVVNECDVQDEDN